MYPLLIVLHIMLCLFLIVVILLQAGKGASIGAAFGGSSQTVFGARGGQSILGKMTAIVAGLFMVSAMVLAFLASRTPTAIPEEFQRPPAPVESTEAQAVEQAEEEEAEAEESTEAEENGAEGTAEEDAAEEDAAEEDSAEADASEEESEQGDGDDSSDDENAEDSEPEPATDTEE